MVETLKLKVSMDFIVLEKVDEFRVLDLRSDIDVKSV